MPQLAENDATFAVNCIHDLLPCLHLFFIVYPRNMRKPGSTTKNISKTFMESFPNKLRDHSSISSQCYDKVSSLIIPPCVATQRGKALFVKQFSFFLSFFFSKQKHYKQPKISNTHKTLKTLFGLQNRSWNGMSHSFIW
jgi:hypothetical protein